MIILSGFVSTEKSMSIQNKTLTSPPLIPSEPNLNIGDMVKLPGIDAGVIGANKSDHVPYNFGGRNNIEVAGTGNVLIIADFIIKNTGNKTIRYSNTPFALRDNAGYRYNPVLYAGNDGVGLLNETYPGQTKKGTAVYNVPLEAHGLNFYLDTNSFTGPDFASLPMKIESISWWPGR